MAMPKLTISEMVTIAEVVVPLVFTASIAAKNKINSWREERKERKEEEYLGNHDPIHGYEILELHYDSSSEAYVY